MFKDYPADKIIKEYSNKIYWLALSICRNSDDAKDILQNTLIKILSGLNRFRNRSHISTWIYRIAYNESLIFLRKKKRQFNSVNILKKYNNDSQMAFNVNWSRLPDEQLLDKEFKDRLDTAINNIPLQLRMPILLHRIEGLPLIEISKILKVSPNAIKTRLHRAYLMIRDEIDSYFRDEEKKVPVSNRSCNARVRFLYEYVNGKMPPREKFSFRNHLKDCKDCTKFLDSYAKAIYITGALQCYDLPLELQAKIKTFLNKIHKK